MRIRTGGCLWFYVVVLGQEQYGEEEDTSQRMGEKKRDNGREGKGRGAFKGTRWTLGTWIGTWGVRMGKGGETVGRWGESERKLQYLFKYLKMQVWISGEASR